MANEKLVERLLWHGEFFIGEAEVSISYQFLEELIEALRAQPSAASGRELPDATLGRPVDALLIELRRQAEKAVAKNGADHIGEHIPVHPTAILSIIDEIVEARAQKLSAGLQNCILRGDIDNLKDQIAALTGAAPADANVGGQKLALQEAHAAVQEFRRAWIAVPYFADRVNRATREAISAAISHITNMDAVGGPLDLRRYTSTAPEPSAPADKVDAYMLENMIDGIALQLAEDDGCETDEEKHQLIWEGNPPEPWGEVWQKYIPDAKRLVQAGLEHANVIDAAIDRMRSESGKGGKL